MWARLRMDDVVGTAENANCGLKPVTSAETSTMPLMVTVCCDAAAAEAAVTVTNVDKAVVT